MIALSDIQEARGRIRPHVLATPVLPAPWLDQAGGGPVYLKPESLQATGSFKARGAGSLLLSLGREALAKGVVTASSGNHGLGVAFIAARLGCPATVIVPDGCTPIKMSGLKALGARVVAYGRSSKERRAYAHTLADEEGMLFVHSHDDPLIAAGQGTIGLEILDSLPGLGAVVVPVGGGGLIAGIATAIKESNPAVKVYGVEPEIGCCMKMSLDKGEIVELPATPATIADGLRGTRPGALPFAVAQKYVDGVVTVSEAAIRAAVRGLLRRSKLVIEPSGAVVAAAVMQGLIPPCEGPVCAVLSGGNIDERVLIDILSEGED
ncbi:threonine/serine dehydratase [Oleispirillum naphthae]|uniref:threonine ammonia-lyase n=1 Tax=Oleispirillum naphthae TaxID=2838853 RepID=UPI00308247D7